MLLGSVAQPINGLDCGGQIAFEQTQNRRRPQREEISILAPNLRGEKFVPVRLPVAGKSLDDFFVFARRHTIELRAIRFVILDHV